MGSLRHFLFQQLSPEGWGKPGLSPTNKVVCALIVMASLVAIVETECGIREAHDVLFEHLEQFFVVCFALEYGCRIYSAGENPKYVGLLGRLRYAFSFWSLVDLIAILPYGLLPVRLTRT